MNLPEGEQRSRGPVVPGAAVPSGVVTGRGQQLLQGLDVALPVAELGSDRLAQEIPRRRHNRSAPELSGLLHLEGRRLAIFKGPTREAYGQTNLRPGLISPFWSFHSRPSGSMARNFDSLSLPP